MKYLNKLQVETYVTLQNIFDKIKNEDGKDGGGMSWIAGVAVSIALLGIIFGVLAVKFPELLNAMIDKVKTFFA